MTTWAVRNEQDRATLIRVITKREKLPFTASLTSGAPRTIEQNRLQRKWMLEAQEQGDMTAEEYRGFCKLNFGIPILRAENEKFCEAYDRIIRAHSYEEKTELMMVPFDFPVTRIMTTKQKSAYLDKCYLHFTELGFQMTMPGER
jgi:hypothetical protein